MHVTDPMNRCWTICIDKTLPDCTKDGSTKDRHEHVDHFIETWGGPDLADRLTLLRLSDADDLEGALCARDRAKSRQKKAAFGSSKFRQKASNDAPSAPPKQVRAIQIHAADPGSESSNGSDRSDSEMDSHRWIYLTANQEVAPNEEDETVMPDPGHQDPGSVNHIPQEHRSSVTVSTVTDARIADPRSTLILDAEDAATSEAILRIIAFLCGELHDMCKCPMEELYNQIRQWFN
ncbi:hypothetical protein PHMEG_0002585 [Phytophthora megakarya]|uniref:Uncharacterized protein n=1 Tax=Phytophthora megakarya TaxID=4795 RepID=A0A225WYC8_9STRA|nr:hypothetical protein PHMEG_0002585 [Phytophthora megakarya]